MKKKHPLHVALHVLQGRLKDAQEMKDWAINAESQSASAKEAVSYYDGEIDGLNAAIKVVKDAIVKDVTGLEV